MSYNKGVKQLPLSKGEVALVDDTDFEYLSKFKWSLNGMGRAHRKKPGNINVMLHRTIMNPPREMVVDHIDGNPLNNQRTNLRVCTQSDNLKNKRKYRNNTSGVKGVTWDKRKSKWLARKFVDNKQRFIGYYSSISEARKRLESCQ